MPTPVEQKVTQVLQGLEESRTQRMRDEAALGALENERRRISAEATEKYNCRTIEELKAEQAKLEQAIYRIVEEAERLQVGGEVF